MSSHRTGLIHLLGIALLAFGVAHAGPGPVNVVCGVLGILVIFLNGILSLKSLGRGGRAAFNDGSSTSAMGLPAAGDGHHGHGGFHGGGFGGGHGGH
jgi:hypothetical protein